MKNKPYRIMAYIYMPFLFMLLGYSFIYIAVTPAYSMLQATVNMVLAKDMPDFNNELKSIYHPGGDQGSSRHTQGDDAGNIYYDLYSTSSDVPAAGNDLTNAVTSNGTGIATSSVDINQFPENIGATDMDSNRVVPLMELQFPDQGTHFANLSCSNIGLDAPVYWGDTDEILKAGVGQFTGSFLPGFNRSILLSAHNTTFFKPLKNIKKGDAITFQTNYGTYIYQVSNVEVISTIEAKRMLNSLLTNEKEMLIMYTCYPFETLVGTKKDRLFVLADKISGPTVE